MKLLCDYKSSGENNYTPALDVREKPLTEFFKTSEMRKKPMPLSPLPEREVIKHFTRLSEMNYHVDRGMYPLGSCTMKYNPKASEDIASLNELLMLHPETPESEIQGAFRIMFELGEALKEISGMDAITLQPAAGSHGELTGLLIARAYFNSKKENRRTVLIPDTAHGTNPASCTRAGFTIKEIKSNKEGILDAKNLEKAGVFSIVLESIPWQIAKLITSSIEVPTIGIGAGSYCDGQILVIHDMLGIFTDIKPKFVKYFGNIGKAINRALNDYKDEVINGIYPDREHSYEFPQKELTKINEWIEGIDICEEAHKLI